MTRKASRKPLELYLTECDEPLGDWPCIDTIQRHDGIGNGRKPARNAQVSSWAESLTPRPDSIAQKG
ncbi:hypothetical protein [Croceicoccus sp. Ery5]|uniref:hypothetical protein n=1 Tax=Croceicoccus sp. Ery5 TaxID=1703340 RepID=UPI001E55F211|nr:hypothetical protein [Croceicoccus sp. Ery5]